MSIQCKFASCLRLRVYQSNTYAAKHFLNDPETLVVDSLQGLCALNPQLGLDTENKGGCSLRRLVDRKTNARDASYLRRLSGSLQGRAHLRRWIWA